MAQFFTVLGTLLLIVLIFVAAYWFTKMLGKRNRIKRFTSSDRMEVLDQMTLGPDRQLLVVKAGDSTLLLGITSQQVTLLKEYGPGEFPEPQEPPDGGKQSFGSAFKDTLKDSLKTWGFSSGGKGRKGK